MQELIDKYFWQLVSLVGNGDYYSRLLRGLFNREFYSPLDLDSGRASYGLLLRSIYLDKETSAEMGPCNVLEMMIALAKQIDVHGPSVISQDERIRRYFWMMIENLGLLGYTDFAWGPGMESEFNHVIDIFLDRKYGVNGEGSLFPLQEYPTDPLKKMIWSKTAPKDRTIWSQCCIFDILAWEKRKGYI